MCHLCDQKVQHTIKFARFFRESAEQAGTARLAARLHAAARHLDESCSRSLLGCRCSDITAAEPAAAMTKKPVLSKNF